MMIIEYTLFGAPVSWARTGTHGAQRWTRARVRQHAARHREAAELARPDPWPLDGRYAVEILAFAARRPVGDVDNLGKLVLDGLQGIAYRDDALVERLTVERQFDRDDPRTDVRIVYLGPHLGASE